MSNYEFNEDDKLFNTIKAHPLVDFYIFDSKVYYQNQNNINGALTTNNFNVPTGFIDLFNVNVDRVEASTGRVIGPMSAPDTGLIYPFIIRDSQNLTLKGVSDLTYSTTLKQPGSLITGSYKMSSSIFRELISSSNFNDIISSNSSVISNFFNTNPTASREEILTNVKPFLSSSKIVALETTLNNYSMMSTHYLMSSSFGDKRNQNVNLVSVPSIFYGSEIKKGTVELNFYITGTLVAKLSDYKQNGELIQSSGSYSSSSNGKVAGVVLYKHGAILLTGSWNLGGTAYDYGVAGGTNDNPKWIYWGAGANDNSTGSNPSDISWTSSSYSVQFKGTNYINTKTFFCTAPKGELNWSNNPSFLSQSGTPGLAVRSTDKMITIDSKTIHNIVSSSNSTYSASFANTTYINSVNLYDEEGNLIAVAKTSKPIKKTEDTDFTFKLKLDI
jgi:hypothetical protein